MSIIIVALPKIEDAKRIRKILMSHGFENVVSCSTASAALIEVNKEHRGLIISGYKLPDMHYTQLMECMPAYYELLLLASQNVVSEAGGGVMAVTMPVKIYDLVNTVEMVLAQIERRYKKDKKKPKKRSEKEENYIKNAKLLLMERNHLTEEEAYRYIQKCSMDSGTNMVETAQMILTLIYDEC
ncbi:MAG TPA: ANTAR domain-containing protein [Candidatus Blautia pullicola]|jgi:AmiR/NasT family two-component response regulator|uniref:ANTAR domain-containing protein n=1 Tax=Candidatus Blautia pullicola TaxID=2838498 RepID=A0A9D2JT30_9FIRM|nr:ANTAR domain-containing protein [Candidatus Blautia pullicola]